MGRETSIERTPDGRRVVAAREIDAPRERVWDILTDTEQWPAWGPSVRAVDCDRRYVEAGTTGRVRIPGGVWVPFRVTTCEDYRWTWRVARIPATGHRVDAAGEGCRAVFEIPLPAAGYAPVCWRALKRIEELATESE